MKQDDILFLMHKKVIVSKVYPDFHLAEVRYVEEDVEFFVDVCALSSLPNYANSIPINWFKGNCNGFD